MPTAPQAQSAMQAVHSPDVVAAARVLCKRGAEICNVDEADSWKAYGADYLEDAALALAAAAPETAAERDRLRALNAELLAHLQKMRDAAAGDGAVSRVWVRDCCAAAISRATGA